MTIVGALEMPCLTYRVAVDKHFLVLGQFLVNDRCDLFDAVENSEGWLVAEVKVITLELVGVHGGVLD